MEKVSIIMPAYNEEKRIGKTLEAYSSYFNKQRKNKKLNYEILVVINNTKDKTEEIVKEHIKKNPSIRYLNFKRGGKGFAVIEGFKDALKRENYMVGFVDADMATSPDEYAKLIFSIKYCDGAIASRYIEGAKLFPKQSIQSIIASRIYNALIRILLMIPYRDTQCGAKIFKRVAIESALPYLSMSKWAFDIDLLYNIRKRGFKINEIPTVWSDKNYSKINFLQAGPWMALGVVRLRILNSIFRDFIRIYDNLLNRIWRFK